MFLVLAFFFGVHCLSAASFPTQQLHLDNGLSVFLQPVPNSGEVVLQMYYDVGTGDVDAYGVPHLTEHLMFEGSANVPNGDYDRLLQLAGGESNAWTTHDQTVFSSSFPPEALDLVLFLESDRMGWFCEGITAEDIENQSLVVLQEYLNDSSLIDSSHDDLLRFVLFGDGPRGRLVGGDPFDIDSTTNEEICDFAKTWLQPTNSRLILVGDFDVEQASNRIIHWFSDVKGTVAPQKRFNVLPPKLTQQSFFIKNDLSRLYMAWPTVPFGHEDEAALALLFDMLVHSTEGRLNESNIDSYGWVESDRFGGMMVVHLEGKPQRELQLWFWHQLKSFTCLRKKELKPFLQRLQGLYIRALGSVFIRAKLLGSCSSIGHGKDCFEWDINRRLEVTPNDIQRVLNKYILEERTAYLSAVPNKEQALQNAIQVEW